MTSFKNKSLTPPHYVLKFINPLPLGIRLHLWTTYLWFSWFNLFLNFRQSSFLGWISRFSVKSRWTKNSQKTAKKQSKNSQKQPITANHMSHTLKKPCTPSWFTQTPSDSQSKFNLKPHPKSPSKNPRANNYDQKYGE